MYTLFRKKKVSALLLSDYLFPFIVSFILCLILFWPTFSKQQLPIATDVLTGYHHPFISVAFEGSPFPFPVKNFESFDAVRQNFPWKFLAISQYKKGQWPLWNPTQLSGTPLAAEFLTGAFYPLNIIFAFLPFALGFGILAILQVYLAFINMYLFLRSIPLSKFSSVYGSLVFSLSGFVAGFFYTNVMIHAFLWTPLVLFAINQLFKTRKSSWVAVIALSISLIAISSHLQILFYSFVLTTFYLILKFTSQPDKKLLVYSLLGLVLGLLASAIQLLPSLELIAHSSRVENFSGRVDEILSPLYHLLLFLAPNYFGNPGRLNYFGWPSYYHEYSFYVGIPTLLFALLAFAKKRKKETFFWVSVLGISLLMAINNPLSRLPQKLNFPFLASITPTRAYAYTDLSLAILASLGLEMLLKKGQRINFRYFTAFTVVALFGFAIMFFNTKIPGFFFLKWLFDNPTNNAVALRNLVLHSLPFIATTGLATLLFFTRKKLLIYVILILMVIVTSADLIRQFRIQNTFVPASSIFPQTKITKVLSSQLLPPRIVSIEDRILSPNIGAYYGWENIDGYEPNHIKAYADTFAKYDTLNSGNRKVFGKMISVVEPRSPVIDLLAVDYLFTPYPLEGVINDRNYRQILQ